MSFTIDDLNAIEQAIAASELEVASEGRQVKYRPVHELTKQRDLIRKELQQSGVLAKKKRFSFISRGNY